MSNPHAAATSLPVPPVALFGGLVDVPYEQADCWSIVVRGLRLLGVQWPEDWVEAVTREQALAVQLPPGARVCVGDVYEFDPLPGGDARRHVGLVVATDAGWSTRILHAVKPSTSRIDRLANVRKALRLRRVVRPVELVRAEPAGGAM